MILSNVTFPSPQYSAFLLLPFTWDDLLVTRIREQDQSSTAKKDNFCGNIVMWIYVKHGNGELQQALSNPEMSSRRRNTATKHKYDIELAGSVTPSKKIKLCSLSPPVFASTLSACLICYYSLPYTQSSCCLSVYFSRFHPHLGRTIQVFCFIIKAFVESGNFLCRLSTQQEKALGETV